MPVAVVDASRLRGYTGRYELAAWRFPWTTQAQRDAMALRVALWDGVLYTQIGDEARHALFPGATSGTSGARTNRTRPARSCVTLTGRCTSRRMRATAEWESEDTNLLAFQVPQLK